MNSVSRGRPAHRSQSPSKDKSKFEKEKEQLRAYQLLHVCPGARGIIFIPLWDPQRDQVRTVPEALLSFSASHIELEHYMLTWISSGLLVASPGLRTLRES
jgi:hypothetical protein